MLAGENCGACDICLAEIDLVDDALVLAQKILSCVVRVEERFGGQYVAHVLAGLPDERIAANGHDRLSTWGLLADCDAKDIRDWIEQLVGQGFLEKLGEYNVLQVTQAGRGVLRGQVVPRLLRPAGGRRSRRKRAKSHNPLEPAPDAGLIDVLRAFRRRKADERGRAAYVIFSDATMHELAHRRPSTREGLLSTHGLGERKCADFGEELLREIADYCAANRIRTT
jgi:ATP-dependent DNA helicase RecQ